MSIRPLLPIALSFLSVSALAQQVAQYQGLEEKTGAHYWGALASAQFGELVVGEFTGDDQLDAFVLNGGSPMLLVSPETLLTSLLVSETVLDLALLEGGDNAADSIVTVGTTGLRQHTWNPLSQTFTSVTLQAGIWRGMSAVEVGDLDGNGKPDFVGVSAAGSVHATVLFNLGNGAYEVGRLSALAQIDDAVTLDWTGDGDDEVALLTAWGMEVYEGNGPPVSLTPWGGELLAASFVEPGSTRESLAVVAGTDEGAAQYLVVAGAEGVEGPYALGPLGVVSMATGDLDGDTDEELVLGVTSAASVLVLDNLTVGGQKTFDPSTAMTETEVGDQSRDPAWNGAGVGVGDYDFDGDLDLMLPVQGNATGATQVPGEIPSTVVVLRNDAVDESVLVPPVLGSEHYYEDGEALDISVELDEPTQLLPLAAGETLAIEIALWHTPKLGAPTATTPIWTHAMALPFPPPAPLPGANAGVVQGGRGRGGKAMGGMTLVSEPVGQTFTFATGQTYFLFDDLYSLVIRQVVRDAAGTIVDRGPALTAIYASAESTEDLQALIGAEAYVISLPPPLLGGGLGESVDAGGLTLGPSVPPFGQGSAPNHQ
jgi:hypothetical protein